jgi:hypothetical protein
MGISESQSRFTLAASSKCDRYRCETSYIVMDRIEGVTLEDRWPDLDVFQSLFLDFQLRRYVRVMRSLTSHANRPGYATTTSFLHGLGARFAFLFLESIQMALGN